MNSHMANLSSNPADKLLAGHFYYTTPTNNKKHNFMILIYEFQKYKGKYKNGD